MPGVAPPRKPKTPGAIPPMGGMSWGNQVGGNTGGTGSATGDPGLAAIWKMLRGAGIVPPTVVPVKIGR